MTVPVLEATLGAIFTVILLYNLAAFLNVPLVLRSYHRAAVFDEAEIQWHQLVSSDAKSVGIVIPAYNERDCIALTARSALSLRYPNKTIVVVNDGSTDGSLELLTKEFLLEPADLECNESLSYENIKQTYRSKIAPNLIVLDKVSSGCKADASNAGIDFCDTELFCVIDADTIVDEASLIEAARPFHEDPEATVAVGGSVRLLNGCDVEFGRLAKERLPRNLIALMQYVEYMRTFTITRVALNNANAVTLISGAFGLFSTKAALQVGGYDKLSLGEDYELVMRMHQFFLSQNIRYQVRSVPESTCWTTVPETPSALFRQRVRWQRGALEVICRYASMLLRRKEAQIGLFGVVRSIFTDLVIPVTEIAALLMLIIALVAGQEIVFWDAFKIYMLLVIASYVTTVAAVIINISYCRKTYTAKEVTTLLIAAILENLGFRQFVSIARIHAMFLHIFNYDRCW